MIAFVATIVSEVGVIVTSTISPPIIVTSSSNTDIIGKLVSFSIDLIKCDSDD